MEKIVPLLIPATFLAALVIERVRPARALPPVRGWLLKCLAFFGMAGALNALVSTVLARALAPLAMFDLAVLGVVGGAIVAFVASDLLRYGLHRLMHTVPALWRWTHQLHHSAERVDIAGVAYVHPLDLLAQMVPPTLVGVALGLPPVAGALAGLVSFCCGIFQHLNVRTPQWLGWFVQRPEAHAVHHARGVHAYNYGHLTIWDIAFGTFRNPREFDEPAGFWDGASRRVVPMLFGRDVSEPTA